MAVPQATQLLDQLLALRSSLRKSSKPVPWNWLVPDLVTTLITLPPRYPYCAWKLLVRTETSSMDSALGATVVLASLPWSTMLPPSRFTCVSPAGLPLIRKSAYPVAVYSRPLNAMLLLVDAIALAPGTTFSSVTQ